MARLLRFLFSSKLCAVQRAEVNPVYTNDDTISGIVTGSFLANLASDLQPRRPECLFTIWEALMCPSLSQTKSWRLDLILLFALT